MVALLAGLAGCAGVQPREGSYVVSGKGYRVGAPAGWTRIESEADLALRRAEPPAGLMANATCEGKPPTRPLPILARHLRFGLRDVQDLVETSAALDGLSGTAQRFRATLDGVPVAVEALTLQGGRCIYDLVGVAMPDGLAALQPDFERFTAGFVVEKATP
jgi:hypothetical protein